jgi:hypothetical protein
MAPGNVVEYYIIEFCDDLQLGAGLFRVRAGREAD